MKAKKILLAAVALILAVSCSDDFLDPKLDNSYGDDITWTLPGYAQGVLYNAYANITQVNPAFNNNNYLDVITDNALTIDYSSSLYKFISGGQSAASEPFGEWGTAYNQFRNIHLFLENGLGEQIKYDLFDGDIDRRTRERLRGEAYFLRAWWGMYLLQIYGGIGEDGQALGYPIVTRSFSYTKEDAGSSPMAPRNTYAECVAQIVADSKLAERYLPMQYTGNDGIEGEGQIGRADGRTAWAVMSRAAIYEASPAYRPAGISAAQVEALWLQAALYAKKAIDTARLGAYTALTDNMIVGSNVQNNYPDELLLRRWWYNPTQEQNHFPPMFFGAGKTNPSQNLVDAFPMSNGYPISDLRSGYDPQNPYNSRDRRFAFTIYCNGMTFNAARPLEIYTTSDGYKGRDAAGYDYRNTRTGYYLRKGMSTIKDFLYNPETLTNQNDYHQRGVIRRAEVYYNLAEAMNQLYGPQGTGTVTDRYGNSIPLDLSAYDIIRDIRSKNGITGDAYIDEVAASGKDAFHDLIMNERRIEFAFENHRFFDMRRWKMPLNVDILGVNIVKDGNNLTFSGTTPGSAGIVVESRDKLADEKYFYTPIPQNEILKNGNLKQNKGW